MTLIVPKFCWWCNDSVMHIDGRCGGCDQRAERRLKKRKKQKDRIMLVRRRSGIFLPRSYK